MQHGAFWGIGIELDVEGNPLTMAAGKLKGETLAEVRLIVQRLCEWLDAVNRVGQHRRLDDKIS